MELLCEQVESADVVVLNKTDLANAEQVIATAAVASALNEKAVLRHTSFGKVALSELVGLQTQAREKAVEEKGDCRGSNGHAQDAGCQDADCQDADCQDCHSNDCRDPNFLYQPLGWSHSQSDPGLTTAAERFGIASFCYAARRPFHADRLAEALEKWPVSKQDDLGDVLSASAVNPMSVQEEEEGDEQSPLSRVIRSKGFCWIDSNPSSRMFWSHAGKNMVLQDEGLWWGAVPEERREAMQRHSLADYERARREEWSEEWADRRQEIVFIGQRLDEAGVRAVLDGCLLTDEEMAGYREAQARDEREVALSLGGGRRRWGRFFAGCSQMFRRVLSGWRKAWRSGRGSGPSRPSRHLHAEGHIIAQ